MNMPNIINIPVVFLAITPSFLMAGTVTFTQPNVQTDPSSNEQYAIVSADDAAKTGVTYAATTNPTNGVAVTSVKWTFTNATDSSSTTNPITEKYNTSSSYGTQNPTLFFLNHPNSNSSQPFCTFTSSSTPVCTINTENAAIGVISSGGSAGSPTFINDTNNNRNFVVGEQINLSVVVPGDHQPTAYSWTMPPGVVFKKYVDTTGVLTPLLTSDLNSQTLSFYWADSADNRVITCKVTVARQNYDINTTVNVKRPVASVDAEESIVSLNNDHEPGHIISLYLGTGFSGAAGITFTPTITPPPGFTGSSEWIQVINSGGGSITNSGTTSTCTYAANSADGAQPYDTASTTGDEPALNLQSTTETPDSVSQNSTMYLMWKPSSTNSNWVPLRKITWSWSGACSYSSSAWKLGSSSPTSAAKVPDADSTTNPTWSQIVNNTFSPPLPPGY